MATNNAAFPMPPATADLQTTWAFLEEGVDHIMTKLQTGVSYSKYMSLYTVAYNYCTSSKMHGHTSDSLSIGNRTGANLMGSDLYNNLIRYFVTHLKSLREKNRRSARRRPSTVLRSGMGPIHDRRQLHQSSLHLPQPALGEEGER